MRPTEILIAAVFLSYLMFYALEGVSIGSAYAPNASENITMQSDNISQMISENGPLNYTNKITTFSTQMQNLTSTSVGNDWYSTITTAFGLSVYFGIETIKMVFATIVAIPYTLVSAVGIFVNMIGNGFLIYVYGTLVLPLTMLILLLIIISIARLFKPDI